MNRSQAIATFSQNLTEFITTQKQYHEQTLQMCQFLQTQLQHLQTQFQKFNLSTVVASDSDSVKNTKSASLAGKPKSPAMTAPVSSVVEYRQEGVYEVFKDLGLPMPTPFPFKKVPCNFEIHGINLNTILAPPYLDIFSTCGSNSHPPPEQSSVAITKLVGYVDDSRLRGTIQPLSEHSEVMSLWHTEPFDPGPFESPSSAIDATQHRRIQIPLQWLAPPPAPPQPWLPCIPWKMESQKPLRVSQGLGATLNVDCFVGFLRDMGLIHDLALFRLKGNWTEKEFQFLLWRRNRFRSIILGSLRITLLRTSVLVTQSTVLAFDLEDKIILKGSVMIGSTRKAQMISKEAKLRALLEGNESKIWQHPARYN